MQSKAFNGTFIPACEEGQGVCAHLMVIGSILLILVTMPFSLVFVVKVVQVRRGHNPADPGS